MYDVYVKCLTLTPKITLFKEASVLDNILPEKMLQHRKETFHKTVLGGLKHTHFSRIWEIVYGFNHTVTAAS